MDQHLYTLRVFFFFSFLFGPLAIVAQETPEIAVPNEKQIAWQEAEFGVVFHYDLHVFDGKPYDQQYNRITPVADLNIFDPTELDIEQWVLAAKVQIVDPLRKPSWQ